MSDNVMILDGTELKQVRDVLAGTFTRSELKMLVRIRLNRNLDDLVDTSVPMLLMLFELIALSEREGWMGDLIAAAKLERPQRPDVQALGKIVEHLSDTPALDSAVGSSVFEDAGQWRARVTLLMAQVCRVELAPDGDKPGAGCFDTGLLVGPDVVLAPFHVLEPLFSETVRASDVAFRFDFKGAHEGPTDLGKTCHLRAQSWSIDSSFRRMLALSPPQAADQQLNYALVRLDSTPGLTRAPLAAQLRNWVPLPADITPPQIGMPVFLVQHQCGELLKPTVDSSEIAEVAADGTAFICGAMARQSSGGNLCFDSNWNLIGVGHSKADSGSDIISIAAIVTQLKARGFQGITEGQFEKRGALPPRADTLIQKLRDFQPRLELESDADIETTSLHGYRAAAAVLASFNPARLLPLPPAEPDDAVANALLADCSQLTQPGREPRWVLNPAMRRATLESLNRDGMRQALKLNREFPEEPLQSTLSEFILNERPQRALSAFIRHESPPRKDVQQLGDLLTVVNWLDGLVPGLPDADLVRRRLAREELFETIRRLPGPAFVGRQSELSYLAAHVASDAEAPILVHGPGGFGKSALLGKFLLDQAYGTAPSLPFIYLDCGRSKVAVEDPGTLLMEAVRQLGAQFPELAAAAAELLHQWLDIRTFAPQYTTPAQYDSRQWTTTDAADHGVFLDGFVQFLRKLLLPGERLLLVLDTIEDVQRRGRNFVADLWSFLQELRESVPGLRVIAAGRVPVDLETAGILSLGGLDKHAARDFLRALGVGPTDAKTVASHLGGNPLTLKLAASLLIRDDGANVIDIPTGPAVALGMRDEIVQAMLFQRIVGHIHDADVRKLCYAGLVVRRIDPDVIRDVLAGPCGLSVPDLPAAIELFRKLNDEVSLVEPGAGGALYYRPDVRRVLLGLVQQESPKQVQDIHERAIAFYAKKTAGQSTVDPADRAEEIYHRLALGQSAAFVEKVWVPGVENYLRNAVEEFPDEIRLTYLAAKR